MKLRYLRPRLINREIDQFWHNTRRRTHFMRVIVKTAPTREWNRILTRSFRRRVTELVPVWPIVAD